MSKIVQLEHDITISYSWSSGNHGICGHTFEVIDYYMVLKNHFSTGILLCEDITWDTLHSAIINKYDFTEDEIQDIKNNTRFEDRPKLIKCKNIIFTDGGISNINNITVIADNIFYMACGDKNVKFNKKENVHILQDFRLYSTNLTNPINYKKKILFDRLKPAKKSDNVLVYATKNCRGLDEKQLEELNIKYKNILCLVNEIPKQTYSNITFSLLPYNNLMDSFGTYIYTPVSRKWDCSPRLIAECKWFSKNVIYHDIDYWEEDLGLSWRKFDIEWNFDSLHLKNDDRIIKILRDRI